MDEARKALPLRQISSVAFTSGVWPVYAYPDNKRVIALFLCPPGPAAIASAIEEIACRTRAGRFVLFGAAGSLNRLATTGRLILPTAVQGEDGVSRALFPEDEALPVVTVTETQQFFSGLKIPYVCGKMWSSEALYYITPRIAAEKKLDGCLAVEMHLAAAQAVCAKHRWPLYAFFLPGDRMDGEHWEEDQLQRANHAPESLEWALKLATNCLI